MLDAETHALVLMSVSITQRQWPSGTHVLPAEKSLLEKINRNKNNNMSAPLLCSIGDPIELGFTRAQLDSQRGTGPRAAGI